jgi:uncharacterized protein (TIGR02118 family)
MVKLLVLYGHPEDAEAFDRHYRDVHTPLTLTMPHLRGFVVGRPTDAGGPYHLVAELRYDGAADLQASMDSDAGQAAVEDLATFATGGVTVLTVEADEVK